MPTYLYKFTDCDGTIEVQQSFTEPALTEALNPADGELHPVKKVFTPVGVTFKGSGFYKTDARGKSTAAAGSSASSSESSSSSTSTESGSSSATPSTPAPAAASTSPSAD
jgi:predicted nucleic acid-binding Zn ribbon protein